MSGEPIRQPSYILWLSTRVNHTIILCFFCVGSDDAPNNFLLYSFLLYAYVPPTPSSLSLSRETIIMIDALPNACTAQRQWMQQNQRVILCIWENCITFIGRECSLLPPLSSDGAAVLFLLLLITSYDYLFMFWMPIALAHEHTWGRSSEQRAGHLNAICASLECEPIVQ